MNRRQMLAGCAFVALCLATPLLSRPAEQMKGDWTIQKSDEPGKVEFSLITHNHHGNSNHQSDWPISTFQGLDYSKAGKQDVQFTIARDAGKFDCEGYMNDGEGAGVFHFSPDAGYVQKMKALGFDGIDDDKQFSMAVMDVTVEFATQMKGEHLQDLDTDKLISFKIFSVTPEFIHDLRAAGIPATDSDKLVAFRIHGVSPEMVKSLEGCRISAR